jgi:hypothetical protein
MRIKGAIVCLATVLLVGCSARTEPDEEFLAASLTMGDPARTPMCYPASALIQTFWLDLYRVQQWTRIDDDETWEVLMKKVGGELDRPVEHFVRMRFHREGALVDLVDSEKWLTSGGPAEHQEKVEMSVVMQHHLYNWSQGSRFIKPLAGCAPPKPAQSR